MKKHQITLLAGVVGALCGSVANASAITEVAAVVVHLSGSTAASKAVDNAIRSVCDPTTVELYLDKSTSGSNHKAYFCSSKGVNGVTDGTKLMVRLTGASTAIGPNKYATALGGSILGVTPVAYGLKVNFLAVSPAVAAACAGDPLSASGAICDDTVAGLLAPYVPHFGISDMHPAAFILQNAPAATGGISSTALANLSISPGPIQIFNTPVTVGLRDAMQDSQFKAGKLNAACKDLSNRELGVCTPSIPAAMVAKIFGGQVSTWDQVDPALSAKPVKVVRREIGSGTQATLNLVGMSEQYNNPAAAYPCAAGANPVVLDTPTTTVTTTGGAMVTALNNAHTAGDWAMGLLDVTKNGAGPDTAPSASFRYLFVEGVAPTLANVAAGKYVMIAQSTVNRASTWTGSAQELAVVKAITTAFNDPAIVAKGNTAATLKQNFGPAGYMVVGATSCSSDADCVTNPVTAYRFAKNIADAPAAFCTKPTNVWP